MIAQFRGILSNTSSRELAAWASILTTVLVYLPYFAWVFEAFAGNRLGAAALLGKLIGAVVTQLFFLALIHIVLAITLRREPEDERAALIEARSSRLAYNILSPVLVIGAVAIVVTGVVTPEPLARNLLNPIFLSQVGLLAAIVAEMARYLMQVICLRRGC